MAGMPYEMSGLLSQVALPLFLAFLLPVVCYRFTVAMGKPQERRPKKHQRKGKKRHARAFVVKTSRLSRKCCSADLESVYKAIRQVTRTIQKISTYLDRQDWGMSERSNSSWTTITDSGDESCSKVSVSPLSDNSWNSIMAKNDEEDRCLEAGSMHQQKQDLQIQLGAPSPAPEERDMEGKKTKRPTAHHKSQNTVEAFNPEKKLQQKEGLPAKVDQTLQDATASASPSRKPQKTRDMRPLVLPVVRDPPCLDIAVKSQLGKHIVKKKIQRRYGLPTNALEYERNSEVLSLIQEAFQLPSILRRSVVPYRSPFARWDRRHQGKKAAREHPGPQKEPADPVDTCSRGTPAPSAQPQKARHVLVRPIVRDPPYLDISVKSQLEKHIVKKKIQRRYGLPTKVLEYEKNSEDLALIQEASQLPSILRRSVMPYRSPFARWDRRRQGKKAAREHPGPQKEPADPVDTCSRGTPAPSAQPQKARHVLVRPIVRDPPYLDIAVKSQLEKHIVKKKIQRRYGLPTKVLEYERNSEDLALIQEASQLPSILRRSVVPYRSPFARWDRRRQGKKAAREHPGPQKEPADPVDTCSRGTPAPSAQPQKARHVLVRPIVRDPPYLDIGVKSQLEKHIEKMKIQRHYGLPTNALEYEMAQQDGETPQRKRKHGELAGGSKAGKNTLTGTPDKEQGPGTPGGGHSPSLSGQAKWALPQSKAAPQGQSGQGSESPSISWGHMGPPELPLEKSIPVREADHSMEGQSNCSEDVGTPELPSKLAAPLSISSPKAQRPSLKKRPPALPLSPDSAGTNFLIPFLSALTNYFRTKQAVVDLCNQLRLSWQQQHPDKTELPFQSRSPRGTEKGARSAQDRASSRRLSPQCSKAPHQPQVMKKVPIFEFDWPP